MIRTHFSVSRTISVLVPIEVIEEIDRFKRESTELGQNARTVSRMLDGFRGEGQLERRREAAERRKTENRFLQKRPETAQRRDAASQRQSPVDNRILSLAAGIQKSQPNNADDPRQQRYQFAHQGRRAGPAGGGLRDRPRLHQGPLHRHDGNVRQPGKNGLVPRQRRTRNSTAAKNIFRTNTAR